MVAVVVLGRWGLGGGRGFNRNGAEEGLYVIAAGREGASCWLR